MSSGLKPAATETGLCAAAAATNAATSVISWFVSWPSNAGMPRPPVVTCRSTRSAAGFSASRLGPIVPVEPAAASVWQPPQPARAKTSAPGIVFGRSRHAAWRVPPPSAGRSSRRERAPRRGGRARRTHASRHQGTGWAYSHAIAGCCSASGYDEFFSARQAARDAARYRRSGLDRAAQWIVDAVVAHGIEGRTVLEPGGGIGAIPIELLKARRLARRRRRAVARLRRGRAASSRPRRASPGGSSAVTATSSPSRRPRRTSSSSTASSAATRTTSACSGRPPATRGTMVVFTYPPRNVLSRLAVRCDEPLAAAAWQRVPRVRARAGGDGRRRAERRVRRGRATARRHLARRRVRPPGMTYDRRSRREEERWQSPR